MLRLVLSTFLLLGGHCLHPFVGSDRASRARLLELTRDPDVVFGRVHIVPFDQSINRGVVHLVIRHGSAPVLDGILDGGHDDNDDQGDGVQTRVIRTEDGDELDGEKQSDQFQFFLPLAVV